jgi:hypothetical protein
VIASLAALIGVGLAGRRRLAPLRRGRVAGTWPPARRRSSPATWLAAIAGAGAVGIAWSAAGWPPWARVILALWAAFVLVAGVVGRVTAVLVGDGAIVVCRALLPDRAAEWRELSAIVPPRWPLGAWRIAGSRGSVTLMPSDLRGVEAVLVQAIVAAGLGFRDGAWRRPG